jgi:hypothetical protein
VNRIFQLGQKASQRCPVNLWATPIDCPLLDFLERTERDRARNVHDPPDPVREQGKGLLFATMEFRNMVLGQVAQKLREGFDLIGLGFLVHDLLSFGVRVVRFGAQHCTILDTADLEFHVWDSPFPCWSSQRHAGWASGKRLVVSGECSW